MALSPLQLCINTHKSPHNSILNKTWLPMPKSLAWNGAARNSSSIPNKRRSLPLPLRCSIEGENGPSPPPTTITPTATTATIVEPAKPVVPAEPIIMDIPDIKRSDFPPASEFVFGTSSSAYQIEGAWNVDGKGPSIWDTYTHQHPERIKEGSNGDVATDAYRLYKEDIKTMKEIGVNSYSFSISWSRILPEGTIEGGINQQAIDHYSDLIQTLLDNGITPFATLFHWDVPQALENRYGGFLCHNIVKDFKDYANLCFLCFGDKVKHWITVNEPWTFSVNGYCSGTNAPGRGTPPLGLEGDSATEPYVVAHHLILAHAAAARLYKKNFQATQGGVIGLKNVATYFVPYDEKNEEDRKAAARAIEFTLGWFVEPLVMGDYPSSMKLYVKDRLPKFKTEKEREFIKGSFDFIGIDYYTSYYAEKSEYQPDVNYFLDMHVNYSTENVDNHVIGRLEGTWIYMYPKGLREILKYMKETYQNPEIYITENGTSQTDYGKATYNYWHKYLDDRIRIQYIAEHLKQLHLAMKEDNANVKGYSVWTLTDDFEWGGGYTSRFGLIYIDFAHGLKRIPKASAIWYTEFMKS